MKYLLMLLCLLVAKPSFAKIVEVDLSYLEGETVTPGYEASVLFNGGEFFKFTQMEVFFDIADLNVQQPRRLQLAIFNEPILYPKINVAYQTASDRLSYGDTPINPGDVFGEGDEFFHSFQLSLMFYNPSFDEGSQVGADEFVTLGSGSYMRVTDEPNGLFTRPIPETSTFALFLLGAVGLCVRRQMKQS